MEQQINKINVQEEQWTFMDGKTRNLQKKFYSNSVFLGLMLAPVPIWVFIYYQTGRVAPLNSWSLLQVIVLYPVIEEIIFRGFLQPWIAQRYDQTLCKLTVANLITSGIFTLVHLFEHSALWALATFIPSLIFGYSRERYKRLLAPIILHSAYNGGYFLIGATLVN
jgi:uncharacterized protein